MSPSATSQRDSLNAALDVEPIQPRGAAAAPVPAPASSTPANADSPPLPVARPRPEPAVAARADAQPAPIPAPQPAPRTPDDLIGITAIVGSPPAPEPDTPTAGDSIVLDALVGQINGRPLFASEVLGALDGRLRAISIKNRADETGWQNESMALIRAEITTRVRDELILSEAQASLTIEQRAGLLYILSKLQSNIVSAQGGSAVQADEASRQQSGRSLSSEVQDRLDRELIRNEIRTKVLPKVNVSWRQVLLAYERAFDRFNPPATATFRMIQVPANDAAAVAAIEQGLREGRPFKDLAAQEPNTFGRAEAGKHEATIPAGQAVAQAEIFGPAELNTAAQSLQVGGTTGPFPFRERQVWLHLESIAQPPQISLYDAQLLILEGLENQRTNIETKRYVDSLMERGTFSPIDTMAFRLREIATERYRTRASSTPSRPGSAPPTPPPPAAR